MKFDDLDRKMRALETMHDRRVPTNIYTVARLDGRNFTRLTKETHRFEAPFDATFHDHMIATTRHLMDCGFRTVYGYTQSDEISLLLHREESAFGRKVRKLISVLAGEASARFSLLLGDCAVFDCRLIELPTTEQARDYFRWRHEDAHRNALNAHCYWALRKEGKAQGEATAFIEGMAVTKKRALLQEHGVDFDALPGWQKRGAGLCWQMAPVTGVNPLTGQQVPAQRRRIAVDLELPEDEHYSVYVTELLSAA